MNRRRVIQQLTFLMGGVCSGPTLMALASEDFNFSERNLPSEFDVQVIDLETLSEVCEMIIPRKFLHLLYV
jgi:hypothetical protein